MPMLHESKDVMAFLDLIALSEGTSTSPATLANGYDVIVNGIDGNHTISDYSNHPFASGRDPIVVTTSPRLLKSTASGRYQITLPTWQYIVSVDKLPDFQPGEQDRAALRLLRECGALTSIDNGSISGAISAASQSWCSFPGSDTRLPKHSLMWLIGKFKELRLKF